MTSKKTVKTPETDWKTIALDCLNALQLMNAHYNDLGKSNPGFMGKLTLQHYDLWNEALVAVHKTLQKYDKIKS